MIGANLDRVGKISGSHSLRAAKPSESTRAECWLYVTRKYFSYGSGDQNSYCAAW